MLFEGISDTFTRKPSEVQCFLRVSPTLLLGNCRRSCGYKNQEGGFGGDFVFGVGGFNCLDYVLQFSFSAEVQGGREFCPYFDSQTCIWCAFLNARS